MSPPGHQAPRQVDPEAFLARYRQLTIGTTAIAGTLVLIGVIVVVVGGSTAAILPGGGGLLTLVLLAFIARHVRDARAALGSGSESELVLTAEVRGGYLRRYRSELTLPGDEAPFVRARTLYTEPIGAQARAVPVTVHGSLAPGSVFVALGAGIGLVGRVRRRS